MGSLSGVVVMATLWFPGLSLMYKVWALAPRFSDTNHPLTPPPLVDLSPLTNLDLR